MSLLECNDATRQMQHRQVVLRFSFPPHEQATIPIVPTVGALHHPAARLAVHAAQQQRFPPTPDVWRNPAVPDGGLGIGVVVPLVETEVQGPPGAARRADHRRIQHRANHPFVVDVRSRGQHRDGNATSIRQDVPLHPELAPIRRVPTRTAPLSAPSPSRCRGSSTVAAGHASCDSSAPARRRPDGTRPAAATAASADGRSSRSRTRGAALSIDTPCGAGTVSPRGPRGPARAAGPRAAWVALAAVPGRSAATAPREPRRSWHPCLSDERTPCVISSGFRTCS